MKNRIFVSLWEIVKEQIDKWHFLIPPIVYVIGLAIVNLVYDQSHPIIIAINKGIMPSVSTKILLVSVQYAVDKIDLLEAVLPSIKKLNRIVSLFFCVVFALGIAEKVLAFYL